MTLSTRIRIRCVECGDCLIWQGVSNRGKNPQIRVNGKTLSVRRVLWEEKNGPCPTGKHIATTCETRNCVSHTEPQTRKQIARRVADTGVYANIVRCAKIAATKQKQVGLLPAQIEDVRFGGGSLREAALRNGISKGAAGFIRRGQRWKDYSSPFGGLGAR